MMQSMDIENRFALALAGSTGPAANDPVDSQAQTVIPDGNPPETDPCSEPSDCLAATIPVPAPVVGGILMKKRAHNDLILEGICSRCAHCALKLTDGDSIERGIGPICSRRGYFDDPKQGDEIQAMIDLAEYPELVDFLTEHYKPQGIRKMVNGLVRVCSLNRKSPVHQACTDAIESLGYDKLASLLRESLACIEIKTSEAFPGSVEIWVKRADWKYAFTNALRGLHGAFFSRAQKATIVPMTKKVPNWDESMGPKEIPILSNAYNPETKKYEDLSNKRIVWNLMLLHYKDYFVKTAQGTIRIREKSATKKV